MARPHDPLVCRAAPRRLRIARGLALASTLVGLVGLGGVAQPAAAAVVPAELVVRAGDVPMGTAVPVASTRPPFVLADGSVAFVGLLDDGDSYVFIDDQVVWLGTNEMMAVLSGTESSMGAVVGGGFVYSPFVDGNDAVWTHNGLLALEGDQAPVLPVGVVTTFHSRPSMIDNGTVYWVAGINTTGGTSTEQRVLYRSPTALPADTEVMRSSGDMVGALLVAPLGVDFDYDVSAGELHRIHVLLMDTGSTVNDGHIEVDGALLHQENTPNGTGDNWDNFDLVTINDQGIYVMSGDTSGDVATDEFVAVNGQIAVREGDVVGGIALTTTALVRALSVDGAGRIVHAWSYAGNTVETVFFACDPNDLAGSSIPVLTTGVDELDLDGDGLADALVTDLEATNTADDEALADSGLLYLEVELDDGMGPLEAMVRVPVTCCGNAAVDDGEQCDDGNGDDTDACPGNCMFAVCGDGYTWAGMEECDDGDLTNSDACLTTCVAATCGDGFLWAGVEECDDGNGDDTDICPGNCMVASCGDGYVWAGMEECDDANGDDTDACLSSCVAASCGDGIVQVGVEACDDGNGDDTDACPGTCQDATCGDGFVQAGVEECDDGNGDDTDGCTNMCMIVEVGDSSSGGGESADSTGDDTGEPPGTTTGGDQTTTDPGGLDTSGGAGESSTGDSMPPLPGSTGASTGETEGGTFGGLDDDGGCTCRAGRSERGGSRGGLIPWLALVLLGIGRRRRD